MLPDSNDVPVKPKIVTTILEWNFSPKDFFEESFELQYEGNTINFSLGMVVANLQHELCNKDREYRQSIHEFVNNRFLAEQMLTSKSYNLTPSRTHKIDEAGKNHHVLDAETGHYKIAMSDRFDTVRRDAQGVTIRDSKAERLKKHKEFYESTVPHIGDKTLQGILKSKNSAIGDPENELIHLYEILDALAQKFDGGHDAQEILNIKKEWSRLGKLCNALPLKEGRHRGKGVGNLRPTTQEELSEAHSIVVTITERYIAWLDKQKSSDLHA